MSRSNINRDHFMNLTPMELCSAFYYTYSSILYANAVQSSAHMKQKPLNDKNAMRILFWPPPRQRQKTFRTFAFSLSVMLISTSVGRSRNQSFGRPKNPNKSGKMLFLFKNVLLGFRKIRLDLTLLFSWNVLKALLLKLLGKGGVTTILIRDWLWY